MQRKWRAAGPAAFFQLAAGVTSSIPVTVTAEDGTSTRTYTLALTRASRPQTVSVQTGSFGLECPSKGVEGATLSCTLTNTGSSSAAFPVVALIHSSLDSDPATVAEDSILPASHPSYQDDVGFPDTVRTSDAYAYTYGYGELFSGGSREYVTYGYEKFSKTEAVDAGATQTISIVLHGDTVGEDPERFYVGLAPADYTGLKKFIANKAPILMNSPNQPPVVNGPSSVSERYAEHDTGAVATFSATDLEDDIIWSLAGADAAAFTITAGVLRFSPAPDYEAPADTGEDNVYNVTVRVSDGKDADGNTDTTVDVSIPVTVTVTNLDEPGSVTSPGCLRGGGRHCRPPGWDRVPGGH